MRLANPLLGHDLVAMAAPVTKWSVQIERADEIAPILRRAFKVATDSPKGPVFVALPIDVMEQETSIEAMAPDRLWRATAPDPNGLAEMASALLKSQNPAIVAGDDVARSGATGALVALVEPVGASVWFEGLRHHASFPTGHPNYRASLPGDAAQVRKALEGADLVLLLGGPFFEDIWYAARRALSQRRGRRPDRGIARAPRIQSSPRCRPGRRSRCQPRRADGCRARRGHGRIQARPRNAATPRLPSRARRRRKRIDRGWRKAGAANRFRCRA